MMGGKARVLRPNREQLHWDMIDLEGLLASDHRARIVWSFVESLDLSALYDAVGSREGEVGRPAADPAVLMALWLYATVEGVGSARALARLAERDLAYRWLAASLGQLNKVGEAQQILQTLQTISPSSFEMYIRQRPPEYCRVEYAPMLQGLRKAGWKE